MQTIKDTIVAAIRQGAPAYNEGRPDICYELYKSAAQALLDSKLPSEPVAEALRSSLTEAAKQGAPSDSAWVMRHCFDDILDGTVEAQAQLQALPPGTTEFTVLDFCNSFPSDPRWYSMNDGVMGGLSSSAFAWDAAEGAAVFAGNVTTANNGGFSSVRSDGWGGFGLFSKSRGVRMTVKGDGRVYKLSAKSDDGFDGVMYQHDFCPPAGVWRDVDLPFEAFKPNFRGRVVPGRPPLRGSQVKQLGLMISKFSDTGGVTPGFKTGTFRLAVRYIKGFV